MKNTNNNDYQSQIKKHHSKMKKRIISTGKQEPGEPYKIKPDLKRSKSAPPGFGALGENEIKGGLGDGKPDSDFDPIQLKKGIKVESEHTKDPNIAKEIAKDHLTEDPEYYIKLNKMENNESTSMSTGSIEGGINRDEFLQELMLKEEIKKIIKKEFLTEISKNILNEIKLKKYLNKV